jgi:predicted porin
MQKKVLAAVIGGLLVAPAVFADSANVTISGRIAVGLESYKLSGTLPTGVTKLNNEQRVSDQSSSLIFSGAEDLGGGMKAWFQIDTRPTPDLGGITATGNTQAGLSGSFGKIAIGRADVHYQELSRYDATRAGSLQTILSDGIFSQVGGVSIANATRTPNMILWDSPDWGGITARLGFSPNAAANEGTGVGTLANSNPSKGQSLTAAIRWTGGPMSAGASYWKQDAEGDPDSASVGAAPVNCTTALAANITTKTNCLGSGGDQKSQRAWFAWSAAGLTAALGYDSSEARPAASTAVTSVTMVKRNAMIVPVNYAFGSEKVYFTYAKANKLSGLPAALPTDGTDATAYMLGYDHAFSKRTYAGVFYSKVDNKTNAAYDLFALGANGATPTAFGQDATQLYLGLTHLF